MHSRCRSLRAAHGLGRSRFSYSPILRKIGSGEQAGRTSNSTRGFSGAAHVAGYGMFWKTHMAVLAEAFFGEKHIRWQLCILRERHRLVVKVLRK